MPALWTRASSRFCLRCRRWSTLPRRQPSVHRNHRFKLMPIRVSTNRSNDLPSYLVLRLSSFRFGFAASCRDIRQNHVHDVPIIRRGRTRHERRGRRSRSSSQNRFPGFYERHDLLARVFECVISGGHLNNEFSKIVQVIK